MMTIIETKLYEIWYVWCGIGRREEGACQMGFIQ